LSQEETPSGVSHALLAGFVINGTTSKTVLIRASGPAIGSAPFNIPGFLPDPQVELFSEGTSSVLMATNAGCSGSPQITAAAAGIGAFPWGNPASKDSALLITLAPGTYTAQVSGTAGDTGVSIIEVYDIP
jgi:hypothetical protein